MSGTWVRRLRTAEAGAAAQLLCFPCAGGAAGGYARLARALAPDLDVHAVQYPGRQDRLAEPPARDLAGIVDHVVRELPLHCAAERPLALFGHSMGALLAFETARRLERDRSPFAPVRLFLSGRASPVLGPRADDFLRDDATLLAQMRRLGGAEPQVLDDPDMRDLIMPSVRADHALLMRYTWDRGTLRDCPFTVLVGDRDPVVTVAEADRWRQLTSGPTRTVSFPGGHFYLNDRAPELAATVREALFPAGRANASGG
ncbi:putative thioesterase [Streptomyces zinciresistens K42]|uniref:Putative thioesterase n=1 Tax=Streptomyces zinciresistens K42 TaxID=700597 RepID=G2GEE6_9ACTN|nr:alpha/beta fold hydrolase [Streptomyces zinciresistens]EGX58121.1 putative thioesterase [Streptomyces zinciresistens K42]